MYSNTALIVLLLGVLSLPAGAVPQTRHDRAYPQESYVAEDYHVYNPQTLFDLLQRLPGISLGQQADGREEIQLHGIDSRYLLLLINGQPLAGAALNNSLMTRQIPASLVQRIDIDRNARADLFTGGGGGGTINVILHDGFSPSGLQLSAGGPEFSHYQSAALNAVDSVSKQAVRLAGEQRTERDRYDGYGSSAGQSGDFSGRLLEQQTAVLLSYNGLLNERHALRLYALHTEASDEYRRNGFYPLNTLLTTPDTDNGQSSLLDRRNQRLGGDVQLQWDRWHLQLFVMHETFRQQQSITLDGALPLQQQQEVRDQRLHTGWQLHQTGHEHRWSTGLSLQYLQRLADSRGTEQVFSINNERTLLPHRFEYDELRLSYFLLDRWQITPDTRMEAGFHTDNYLLNNRNRSGERDSDTLTDTHWLPSFHLLHQLSGRSHLRLSMSQSVRQPDIADRMPYEYRQGDRLWRGNPDLDAETVSSFDLSYEYHPRLRGSSLRDRQHGNQLRLFQRRINNAILLQSGRITLDGTDVTLFSPENADGTALVRGLEADLTRPLPWTGMRAELGLAWYQTRFNTRQPLPDKQRLPGQPDYLLRLGVSQQISSLHYGLLWRMQGDTVQYLTNDSGYALQRRDALQQWDGFLEHHWRTWRAGISVAFTPEPATRYREPAAALQTDEHWQLRVSLSGQF